jgi:tetratricopeptide (TPR) repeat protein
MRKMVFTVMVLSLSLVFASCKEKSEPVYRGQTPPRLNADKEISLLEDAVRKDPKNVGALIRLGNLAMDAQRYEKAIDAYGKALELQPKDVDVRVDLGTCYRNMGMPEKAVEAYRQAIAINPRHSNAHRNLGVVLAYDLKKPQEAAEELQQYLKLMPNAPDAMLIREEILKLRGM